MKMLAAVLAFVVLTPLGTLCVDCKSYVTLDLSNINESYFKKTDKRSVIEITLVDNLVKDGDCIGKVTSNGKILVEEPQAPCSRNVRILRISKKDPYYFDVQEAPSGTGRMSAVSNALHAGYNHTRSGVAHLAVASYDVGYSAFSSVSNVVGGAGGTVLNMLHHIAKTNRSAQPAIEGSNSAEVPSLDVEDNVSENPSEPPGNTDDTVNEESDSESITSSSTDDSEDTEEIFDPEDFENIVEIHTNFQNATARLRFKKDENDKYVEFEYSSKDIDVCGDYTSVLAEKKYDTHNVYRSKPFELIGNVKCGNNVLVNNRNVFGRTLEIDNSTKEIKVKTIPVIGNVFSESFVMDKSNSVYVPKSMDGGFKYRTLDLAHIYSYPNDNEDLQTICGPVCVFYDGCSSIKNRLVALYYEDTPVFFDPSVHCLSAKCEDIDNFTYVTVYAKYKNSEKVKVKTYTSSTTGVFKEVDRKPVDLTIPRDIKMDEEPTSENSENISENDEGTSENDETTSNDQSKIVYDMYSNLGISDKSKLIDKKLDDNGYIKVYGGKAGFVFHIPQNLILENFIGKVYDSNNALIADVKDGMYNREVIYDKEKQSIVVLDEFNDGQFKRMTYVEDSNGRFKPQSQTPLAIDLKGEDLDKHLRLITTSESRTFLTSMNHIEKIGTVKEGSRLVTPNKHQNYRVGLLYNEKELFVHTILNNRRVIHQKFSPAHPFDDNLPPVHVENAKEFILLNLDDISCIYNHLYSLKNLNFTGSSLNLSNIGASNRTASLLEVRNIGDYYSIEVAPSEIFTHCIGYITFAKETIVPIDYNLYSRAVYIPSTSLSHFIVKSCDFTECWSDLYVSKIVDGKVKFELQEKIAVDIDIDDKIPLDNRVSKVLSSSVRFFRIREDLSYKYKIGKVTLKGVLIAEDSPKIFTRMVNFAHSNGTANSDKGTVRVMTVERWNKYSNVYSINPKGNVVECNENKPKDMSLDIQYGAVSRQDCVTLQQRDDVLNFFINWQNSNDYVLKEIKASFYNEEYDEKVENSSVFLPKVIKDNLPGDLPVHVRVHLDKKVVVAIENIPKDLPEPSNLDTYPLDYKTNKYEGQIYAYDIKKGTTKNYKLYVRDDAFRTLYTPFYYDLKKPAKR